MAIPLILAMTGAEIQKNTAFPQNIAYLSCHFSPTDPGLSNLPPALPPNTTVILDDRFPITNHAPEEIVHQLSALNPDSLLLDFQRLPTSEAQRMAGAIVQAHLCPVAVAQPYAESLDCPIFLPPVPLCIPLDEYLRPWRNRQIWLELALDALEITVTAEGSTFTSLPHAQPQENTHVDRQLHCHYKISQSEDALRFYLYRTPDDIAALLEAPCPNVTQTIGLFQELG